jgi:signal peptidase I
MVPTLSVGQRVLVNRIGNNFGDPAVGDITVFHPPTGAESETQCAVRPQPKQPCPQATPRKAEVNFIKRIVAGPGCAEPFERGSGEPRDGASGAPGEPGESPA